MFKTVENIDFCRYGKTKEVRLSICDIFDFFYLKNPIFVVF